MIYQVWKTRRRATQPVAVFSCPDVAWAFVRGLYNQPRSSYYRVVVVS
jgi:hypothetical protein